MFPIPFGGAEIQLRERLNDPSAPPNEVNHHDVLPLCPLPNPLPVGEGRKS